MSSWYGTMIGLRVNPSDEPLAKQFLEILGVDLKGSITEQIGILDDSAFNPSIMGTIEDYELDYMPSLDVIFYMANQLFPPAYVFKAHEEGNDTSDDYSRNEVILDPTMGKKTELKCYYSYGEGINVNTDNPKEEGTKKSRKAIRTKPLNNKVIDPLIAEAESHEYIDLADRLRSCT